MKKGEKSTITYGIEFNVVVVLRHFKSQNCSGTKKKKKKRKKQKEHQQL